MADEENSLIVGAQAGLRVMVDGGVRLTIDVEPKDRVAAMTLFGAPGQPIALAALKAGYAAKSDKPAGTAYRDLGLLCREAIDLCKPEAMFRHYVGHVRALGGPASTEACEAFIHAYCNVESRKDLDKTEGARRLFTLMRKEYLAWVNQQKPVRNSLRHE